MHKILNFICFPFLLLGLILLSQGLLGYNSFELNNLGSNETSSQINNLYSEKEITLKDPPVFEKLSDKLIIKIRKKPISPNITVSIKDYKNKSIMSNLSDSDFDYLEPNKKQFIKMVLPIIISENQSIITNRNFLIDLRKKLKTYKTLNNNEITKLNKIANRFNIKYSNKHKLDLIEEILSNVDIIPNSIALAQAAIESGWGKSRFAKEYNALFGEYTYDQNKGVVPLKREDGDTHLIKSFTSYDNSVSSYFKNINSHHAYKEFRELRNVMRIKNNFTNVNLLVSKLNSYAEDNNYINNLNLVIEKNNFEIFDTKIISY